MRNRKTDKGKFTTILSNFMILVVVVAFIGFLYVFTDNFSTDLKTFYVKCNNTSFIGSYKNYNIEVNKEYKFEIVNTLTQSNEIEISVVPNTDNEETTFEFYVNNVYKQFCYEDSLTKGFEIKSYSNYFTFKATKDLTEILQLNYPTKEITGCPTAIDSGVPYFRLLVQSVDKTQDIQINFNLISEK